MKRTARMTLCWVLVLPLAAMPLRAEVIQTRDALHGEPVAREQSLAAQLRPVVVHHLAAAGVPHDAAVARVAALSDDAVVDLAGGITNSPAGGLFPVATWLSSSSS